MWDKGSTTHSSVVARRWLVICFGIVGFLNGLRVLKGLMKAWNLILLAGCWTIWGARNAKIFNDKMQSQNGVMLRVIAEIRDWVTCMV